MRAKSVVIIFYIYNSVVTVMIVTLRLSPELAPTSQVGSQQVRC